MKSVLISIQPKWCELIASGKKTVEVRKTKPKLDVPFKVYIYQTKKPISVSFSGTGQHISEYEKTCYYNERSGKVIGEFVCDSIITDKTFGHDALFKTSACMSDADISAYCLNKEMYCWHISDLVIYDKPKELSEFFIYCGDNPKCDGCEAFYYSNTESGKEEYCCSVIDGCRPLKRPPQSWCYVDHPTEKGGGEE